MFDAVFLRRSLLRGLANQWVDWSAKWTSLFGSEWRRLGRGSVAAARGGPTVAPLDPPAGAGEPGADLEVDASGSGGAQPALTPPPPVRSAHRTVTTAGSVVGELPVATRAGGLFTVVPVQPRGADPAGVG